MNDLYIMVVRSQMAWYWPRVSLRTNFCGLGLDSPGLYLDSRPWLWYVAKTQK